MTGDELNDLAQRFREREQQQLAALRFPKLGAKILTRRIGIPQSTLTNWLTRKVFKLDADNHRPTNEQRLYSARDALLLACASYFVASGTPLRVAKAFSERFIENLGHIFRPKSSVSLGPTVMIFPRGNEWIMAFKSADAMPEVAVEVFGADDTFRFENLSKDRLPPAYFAFEPDRFITDVLRNLGEGFAEGTAEDHRRYAKEIGKSAASADGSPRKKTTRRRK